MQNNPAQNDPNPFRYCGEYFDAETTSYYLRNRNYEPGNGRFTSEDPIRSGLNWYTYCDNNPVIFNDPSGLKKVNIEDYVKSQGATTSWNDDKDHLTISYNDVTTTYKITNGYMKIDDSKLNERFGFPTKEDQGILGLLNAVFKSFDEEPWYIKKLNGAYIPSSDEFLSGNWSLVSGILSELGLAEALEVILKQFKIDIPFEQFGDLITPAAFGKNSVNRFAGMINKLGNASLGIACVGLFLDIGNTFTADNGNTVKQRLIKFAVQVADFFLSQGVGKAAVKVGIAVAGVFGPVVGAAIGGLLAVGGTWFQKKGKDWILNQFNIK